METLFEVPSVKFSEVPCKDIQDYDGQNFPPIINEILEKYMGSVIFGGSSLIHDLYFQEEDWVRDYDLWCNSNAFKKIVITLSRMELCDKIKDDIFTKNNEYYGRFSLEGLTEFVLPSGNKTIKVQLINVGNISNFSKILESVDLSFNTVFYDGTKLIFVDTTEEQIKSKKGFFRPLKHKSGLCNCHICCSRDSKLSEKEIGRLEKYRSRGFEINNLCPFCDSQNCLSVSHTMKCWKNQLSLFDSSYYDTNNVLTSEKITEIIEFLDKNQKEVLIYIGLFLIISTKNIKLLEEQFEKFRHIIDPYSFNFNSNMYYVVDSGSITLFRKYFEIILPLIKVKSYKRIGQLIEIAYRRNYINIGRMLATVSPRFKLNIFEDKIISYEYMSAFECYLETKDRNVLTSEFDKITIMDKSDLTDTCPICLLGNPNLILGCCHKYCDTCVVEYFMIQERNNNKLKCPLCREYI